MPIWEQYEVEAVAEIKVRVRGELVSQYTVFAKSKGGSNETIAAERPLPQAVSAAVAQCQVEAERLAQAVRLNRRETLGYRDGH